MTTLNFDTNRQRPAVNLTVSRKQKSVLKCLKACKPGGHGQASTALMSAALAVQDCPALHVYGARTDQWISTTAARHHG